MTRIRLRPTGVKGADYINATFVDVRALHFKALCKVYNYVIGIFAFRGTKHAKLVLQLRDHCKVLLETSGV